MSIRIKKQYVLAPIGSWLVFDGIVSIAIHPESKPPEQILRGVRSVAGFVLILLAIFGGG